MRQAAGQLMLDGQQGLPGLGPVAVVRRSARAKRHHEEQIGEEQAREERLAVRPASTRGSGLHTCGRCGRIASVGRCGWCGRKQGAR